MGPYLAARIPVAMVLLSVSACRAGQLADGIERGQKGGQSRVLTLFSKSERFLGWQDHFESNTPGRFTM
jgi:hypothetical protein